MTVVSGREGSRSGLVPWLLSVLCSAAVMALLGCVCALLYPVLKELRELTVRGEDGAEQKMLGLWSVLVISVGVASLCSASSWVLTHLDSAHSSTQDRDEAGLGRGMAALNGVMAMATVVWSLS
ncbi:unnamed protein product [Knipowitschia caucasica]|uniref:Uncharacterized protein n=1 Tax=Knipowitschia caucasica TaxID=637954 RepID=A0AAV2LAW5_KNICA